MLRYKPLELLTPALTWNLHKRASMSAIAFTVPRLARVQCAEGQTQTFAWDSGIPGLGLRVTSGGSASFIFQSRFCGKSVRLTIGDLKNWSIPNAQDRARQLQRMLDEGLDPRIVVTDQKAAHTAIRANDKKHQVTALEVWEQYIEEKKGTWGHHHHNDHLRLSQAGGTPRKRSKHVVTQPGILRALLVLPLKEITKKTTEEWALKEIDRPASLRLSLRLLNTFLTWTAEQDELTGLVSIDAAKSMRAKDAAGKPTPRKNTLRRDQLEAWFTEVRKISNPSISAYLQCTLLTGRRREEIGFIKWSDVNFKWNTIQIKDKSTLLTTIPLTSYMTHLLKGLPRSNEWVFSSVRSASGRLIVPSAAHKQACAVAGLDLSIHDLRRSLATLCEWLELPPGLVAQLQGHAPQGVREKHYIDRPMDLLRIFHERIEAWILMEAKQNFAHPSQPAKSIYAP